MKRSVDLDEELEAQVDETSSLIREKPSVVISPSFARQANS
jgi:hypothetical protein